MITPTQGTALGLNTTASVWLRLANSQVENIWSWKTGSRTKVDRYLNWASSPDQTQSVKECLYLEGQGHWRPSSCAATREFVCETGMR